MEKCPDVKRKSSMRQRKRMHAADWIIYVILGLFALVTLYPFIYVLAGSFSNGVDYGAGGVWLFPRNFTLSNYKVVFLDSQIWVSLRNTVIVTVFGTLLAVFFTSAVAYAMAHPKLIGKGFFYGWNLFTMFFSGGLIARFLVYLTLGLYDSFAVYLIPSMYSVYNMIVIASFFRGISEELREAATLDGADELQIFYKIYLPLSKPVLATVTLWVATGFWNSYYATMMYTKGGDELSTLQYYLMMIKESQVDTSGADGAILMETSYTTITYAAIILAMIPVVICYPFFQKYFSKGIMIGALKG